MFEHHHEPLVPLRLFWRRLGGYAAISGAMVLTSLLVGMAGYHYFEALPWLDAFLNAAMILGGMGPVDTLRTEAGKLFAGLYALYAGLVFITASSLLLLPVAHRMLHHFHLRADAASR